jgi:alpha-D-ribose 1-methylphosphonate 5-triphosphate synthase subunit PhnL
MNGSMISIRSLAKTFVLHTQGGTCIRAYTGVDLDVAAGECVALHGPSGAGKSSLLRSIYANYRPSSGSILVRHNGGSVDMTQAPPRAILDVRRRTLGYVSQFLRVIPRVSTRDLVSERLAVMGVDPGEARKRAERLLARLNIPERLWSLAPATFSGGEQQRVNIARGFIRDYPILLLDEPTASLDGDNRRTVVDMILEAKRGGAAIVGIFHDDGVRERVADRCLHLTRPE